MTTPLEKKSTIGEIRARFDGDVERFSRLETGQQATLDAPLVLELVAQVGARHLRAGDAILDLGCGRGQLHAARGAGDAGSSLSPGRPEHGRCWSVRNNACAIPAARQSVEIHAGDLRALDFADGTFALHSCWRPCLHHLRDDADWEREVSAVRTAG